MKTCLDDEDRILLQRLLAQVLGCLHGALDFWTVVCVGRVPPDPRAFVLRSAEALRSPIVVARTILEEMRMMDAGRGQLLEKMYDSCQKLQDAFLVLADFQNASLEQIRSATETVSAAYTDLQDAVRRLARSLDLPDSSGERLSPEREDYFQRILAGLFDLFRQEREAAGLPAPAVPATQQPS